jgi:AbrB family looped-hinge helix DNA binding protein
MGTTDTADKIEVDKRGRITIPKPVRERLGIVSGDEFELNVEDSRIVLRTEH